MSVIDKKFYRAGSSNLSLRHNEIMIKMGSLTKPDEGSILPMMDYNLCERFTLCENE